MVHTSALTITSSFLDLVVSRAMYKIKKEGLYRMDRKDLLSRLLAYFLEEEWVEFLSLFATLSNICSLLISTMWVILDLQAEAEISPGGGTLFLGVIASVCSFIVLVIEMLLWMRLYPLIMERLSLIVPRLFGIRLNYHAAGNGFGVRMSFNLNLAAFYSC
jgi:hypothetical protein